MERRFKVGDRVTCPGFKFKNEPDRHGEVVECYEGLKNALGQRDLMVAVKWDGIDTVERGYLENGQLKREAIMVTRMFGI